MIKGFLAALSVGLVFVAGTAVAQAAPPANDNFAAAAPLAVGQEISSANLDATAQMGEPDPAGKAKAGGCAAIGEAPQCATSVWYTFQALPGQYTIETCDLGTELNSILGVYTGTSVGSAVEVAANDDESSLVFCPGGYYGQGSRVTFTAEEGTIYHVDLTGYNGEQGSFYLRAYAGSTPQPRPAPDTGIARLQNSFAYAIATVGVGGGVTSGPRHSASFVLESEPEDATFECSLDGSAFAACTSPVSYDGLAPGSSHVFKARAISAGTPDPTPAVERFTLDLTPPETSLTAGPEGDTPSAEPEWTTASSERNQYFESRGFLCRLDGQKAQPCEAATQFASLCQGIHTFSSAAWDRAANVDPTPVSRQINVTSGSPCAPPTLGEPTPVEVEPSRVDIQIPFQNTGGGSTLHVDYGATAAYGMSLEDMSLEPGVPGNVGVALRFLTPGTLYHYRVTISSPFGTASSGDQTVTTDPLTGAETLPTVVVGTPSASEHAALIPVTIDTGGIYTNYFMRIAATGPVTNASAFIPGRTEIEEGLSGPQAGRLEVVDLDPSTTYHFRIGAEHSGSDFNEALGPEGTFTTPPIPPDSTPPGSTPSVETPPAAVKSHFTLRKGAIAIARLERSSKRLLVRVRDLPAGTAVGLELKAGSARLQGRKLAPADGLLKFDVRLSGKVREALLNERVRDVVVRISASPPGDTRSEVTLRTKLKQP